MIISPTLALAALALPTSSPLTKPPSSYRALDILCYDSRYASHKPDPIDCATIIGHRIAYPPMATLVRSFARNPTATQYGLPHTWRTAQGECNVTIDIPSTPGETAWEVAEASMLDIKRGAFEVFAACVSGADQLGGLMQIGRKMNLQVRVEAGDGTA
ncbi:MAG: hypothetical protein Q9184_001927 [Pyrenodesmia sp. 2 TL-2023]